MKKTAGHGGPPFFTHTSRSRLTNNRFPLIVVARSAATIISARSSGTSTNE
jgi:hypothetical protein